MNTRVLKYAAVIALLVACFVAAAVTVEWAYRDTCSGLHVASDCIELLGGGK